MYIYTHTYTQIFFYRQRNVNVYKGMHCIQIFVCMYVYIFLKSFSSFVNRQRNVNAYKVMHYI